MVKLKPSCPPEGNAYKIPTNKNKGQVSTPKQYRGKKNFEINQSWSQKPKLTSRANVLTWKATLLILDQ